MWPTVGWRARPASRLGHNRRCRCRCVQRDTRTHLRSFSGKIVLTCPSHSTSTGVRSLQSPTSRPTALPLPRVFPRIRLHRAWQKLQSMDRVQPSGVADDRTRSRPPTAGLPPLVPGSGASSILPPSSLHGNGRTGLARLRADGMLYRDDAARLVGGGTPLPPHHMSNHHQAAGVPVSFQGAAPFSAGGAAPTVGHVAPPAGENDANYDSILSWGSDPRRRPSMKNGHAVAATNGGFPAPQDGIKPTVGGRGTPLVATSPARNTSSATGRRPFAL